MEHIQKNVSCETFLRVKTVFDAFIKKPKIFDEAEGQYEMFHVKHQKWGSVFFCGRRRVMSQTSLWVPRRSFMVLQPRPLETSIGRSFS